MFEEKYDISLDNIKGGENVKYLRCNVYFRDDRLIGIIHSFSITRVKSQTALLQNEEEKMKGTAEDWLEITKESLKKRKYGKAETCLFCLGVGYRCNSCIFSKFYAVASGFTPCEHYFNAYRDFEEALSRWDIIPVHIGLTELKIALKSLIKGYKRR